MALPPFSPSDTAEIVPQPGDPACTVLSNMTQGLTILNQLAAYMFNQDKSLTQGFLDAIGVGGSNALAAPTGVSASDDRPDDITVTWNEVSDASHYVVFRGTTADTSSMSPVSGELTERSYVDESTSTNVTVFYSVRAYSSSRTSALATPDSGIRRTSATSQVAYTYQSTPKAGVIPTGVTTMELLMWGSGGVGGYGRGSAGSIPSDYLRAGGGGGGGSFLHITGISVTPGDAYHVQIGRKRTAGDDGTTYLWMDSVGSADRAYATAGNDGSNGNWSTAGSGGSQRSPGDWGANDLGTGTVDTVGGDASALGAAGTAGSDATGGAGAAGITQSGITAGGGGTGVQLYSSATQETTYAQDGYCIVKFS